MGSVVYVSDDKLSGASEQQPDFWYWKPIRRLKLILKTPSWSFGMSLTPNGCKAASQRNGNRQFTKHARR
ncbi:MAG: hypothetical protein ACLSAP_07120 [Oscillospiraceae bacterium]